MLYAGNDVHCAFIETLGHNTGVRLVSVSDLRARAVARLDARRPLHVVDLTGPGLGRLGADERLCAGDYDVAQLWSLALHEHLQRPDGLLYRSRHDPSRLCVAIYERAAQALVSVHLHNLADPLHTTLLADLLDTYGFGVR